MLLQDLSSGYSDVMDRPLQAAIQLLHVPSLIVMPGEHEAHPELLRFKGYPAWKPVPSSGSTTPRASASSPLTQAATTCSRISRKFKAAVSSRCKKARKCVTSQALAKRAPQRPRL